MTTNYRALCAELIDWVVRVSDLHNQKAHALMARADAALNAEPEEPAKPSGYAYRYSDYSGGTYIKFNGGEEVNGSRPIEVVPYWLAPPSAPTAPPAPEPGELGELVELLKLAGRWATSTGVQLDRFAALFDQQATELAALREERFVAGQNRINQLWVDALDPSTQVPLSAPQIKKLRKVLDEHCDQGPPNGTMWQSQELEELMWAVEGWVSAATPLPAPQAGEAQP